jgi:predicted nucleic acid-binding Zn ribbon protein
MPRYNIKCEECGYTFDILTTKTYSDEDIKKEIECSKCNLKNCKKVYGKPAGIIYKSDGFYNTDINNKGDKNE